VYCEWGTIIKIHVNKTSNYTLSTSWFLWYACIYAHNWIIPHVRKTINKHSPVIIAFLYQYINVQNIITNSNINKIISLHCREKLSNKPAIVCEISGYSVPCYEIVCGSFLKVESHKKHYGFFTTIHKNSVWPCNV